MSKELGNWLDRFSLAKDDTIWILKGYNNCKVLKYLKYVPTPKLIHNDTTNKTKPRLPGHLSIVLMNYSLL